MVRDAQATAANAEASTTNEPGYCLKWSRLRADIAAAYPDAATAWANANNRHAGDRNPPRGAMVYWTGGASGYGHIAVSLGGGMIRSTDSGGAGKPATVALDWPERYWGLPYAGWADNVNEIQIPGVGAPAPTKGEDMPQYDHAARTSVLTMPPATWQGIQWEKIASGPAFKNGSAAVKIPGADYVAVLSLALEAPVGTTVRVRTIETDSNNATQETGDIHEIEATSGDTLTHVVFAGYVAKERALRFRITADKGGTLKKADAVVLSWQR